MHVPLSPLPRSPLIVAELPLSVPEPVVPSAQRTPRLHPFCVTSQSVFVQVPLRSHLPL